MPRRPARPVSCVYSPGVSGTCCSPLNFTSRSSTTVRAGMLMPSASVSVANTALTRPGGEQLLDGVPERGQHPGVVGRQAAQQPFAPLVVAQHLQVGVRELAAPVLDHLGDLARSSSLVSRSGERRHCCDRGVATGAGKHEGDRGQQTSASRVAITSGRGGGR